MFQPAYYLGRRVHVFHASSHPVTYVYTFVKQQRTSAPTAAGRRLTTRKAVTRLAKADAYRQLPAGRGNRS